MFEERKLAVLIDSDNVSAKYAQFIMQEAAKFGTPTYKRVYGDWEKGGNGWHYPAINYSIMPVQQCSYIAGKNATDFSMIIDAMDILYSGGVDGFVLVTSDSDFTRLAIRLREAGKLVVGIGEVKTPRAFTTSCHHFCYLNQVCEPEGMGDEKTIRRAVLEYMEANRNERIDLAKIFAVLTSRFGNINFEELGFKRFSNFIDSFKELRRSNTFVTLKKPREEQKPVVVTKDAPTEEELVAAIGEYFEKNAPERDNMMKIESYLNSKFGKVDFSRFGSKRFAKFIDKIKGFTRDGTSVVPVTDATADEPTLINAELFRQTVVQYAKDNMPDGGNAGQLNNLLITRFGKGYCKELGFSDFHKALESVKEITEDANKVYYGTTAIQEKPVQQADITSVAEYVSKYAGANMPDGGNIGQLNNELISVFGKSYCADLGYSDYKTMLAAVEGIKVRKNHVYLTDVRYAEYVEQMEKTKPVESKAEEPAAESEEQKMVAPAEKTAKKPTDKKDTSPEEKPVQQAENTPVKTEDAPTEKADINSVKRDVLEFAATNENGSMAALGNMLTEKYGKGYLKELGFRTVKALVSKMSGISVTGNNLTINEDFAKRTEEIEQFVVEFARGEGSRSIRALSTQLKKRFEGFDHSDYGFARFTDFLNAIDGVRADRYHVIPVE